jgi:hypothetical protein
MRIVATIVLSLIAIVAALVLALSTMCAFGFGGSSGGGYLLCALLALGVVIGAMWAIARLNRKPSAE